MWEDFKKFALKGNVVDMAVGVIVGGAFGKIVTSLVNDIIMPFFGWITAGVQFKALKFILSPAVMDGETVISPEVAITYGNFIQNIVDFLIISISIFFVVRLLNNLKKKEEAAPPAPEPPKGPTQEELLTEIRDLLKEQNK